MANEIEEIADLQAKGATLVTELNGINQKLVRKGATTFTVEKPKPYKPAPSDVTAASNKVLKAKRTGMTMAEWLRSINLETGGKYDPTKLKDYLETLIGDETIKKAPGVGRSVVLTLAAV